MAQAKGNVVALGDHPRAKARNASTESAGALAGGNVPTAAHGDLHDALAKWLGAPLEAESGPEGPADTEAEPAPQAFIDELTVMHRALPLASAQAQATVLRSLMSGPQAASLAAADAMTIEVLAMMFDAIVADRSIPAGVKPLFVRLQVPVLKAALLDRAFFSSDAHPARRLLDLLACSALGLEATGAQAAAAAAMLENAVARLLAEFGTDFAIVRSIEAELADFLVEQSELENGIIERSARLVEARERDEVARTAAEEEIARRLETRQWVPPEVLGMLLDAWTHALASVQLAEGEGSPAWQRLLLTMEDLLWSVEPKTSPDDRRRLVAVLPGMLQRLNEGLERGEMTPAARDAFLGDLVDCHAAAVRAGLRGMAAMPRPPAKETPQPSRIVRERIAIGDVRMEEVRLRAPRGQPARKSFSHSGSWSELKRGTWMEFVGPAGECARARLAWISPREGVYLFANPLTEDPALSVSTEALAEQVRLGQARVIDAAPLVERTLRSLLAKLREAQARGEGAGPGPQG